jgi:hypothetical protein
MATDRRIRRDDDDDDDDDDARERESWRRVANSRG